MKKIVAFLLCLCLAVSLGVSAFAAGYEGAMTAEAALLLDPDTGETLYEKDPDARVYPASTTKILTALVVLEHTQDLQELVTVNGGALAGITEGDDSTLEPMLKDGEQLTVEQLLYGLLLVSGNDCAVTLAMHVGGSIDGFVALMNEKAAALGMENSHFRNPHGVQDPEHYTTARDMGRLAEAALEDRAFMTIVSTAYYTLPGTNRAGERQLVTSNRFLVEQEDIPGTACPGVTGMKTGYTPTAGGCLVTSAERDGARLICLIYGDPSENQRDRWFLTKALLDYGFDQAAQRAETVEAAAYDTGAATEIAPPPAHWRQTASVVLGVLFGLLAAAFAVITLLRLKNARRHFHRRQLTPVQRRNILLPTTLVAALFAVIMLVFFAKAGRIRRAISDYQAAEAARAAEQAQAEALAAMEAAARSRFAPQAGQTALPANWSLTWDVSENGQTVSGYHRPNGIQFGTGEEYFALPGVAAFRGNNYRNGGSYGVANVREGSIRTKWTTGTGALTALKATWTGCGWTGQPLIVQWDGQTRNNMNLYAEKKAKDGLVEVIYATLDGHVYFLDLDDGSYTRDPVDLGMPFKGAGALDPRGYPLMYLGAGDNTPDGRSPRMFVLSLIDGSVLYENGYADGFALRRDNGSWCAFDSSPLVDGETDTLIWPGENGVLYTIHLNTNYDRAAGTLTIAPEEPVRWRYDLPRANEETYWYGMESSVVIVDRYLYVSENGGMFFCVDLDSMDLIWAQDTRDDSNSTPVYEPDGEGHGYIYTAPSLHWTADPNNSGVISIYKLDAVTGQIVWTRDFSCFTVDGVSGGVQSSPVLGREGSDLEGLIIYGVSRTPGVESGVLVALDTATGCEVWRLPMEHYAWSSPLALYDSAGHGTLVLCDSGGTAYLIDGTSGQIIGSETLNALVEATPAAYNDTLVVGTRGQMIYGLTVS